ncbi:MAG: PqqD family protein [Deltaproteobacteria bacterium]|nr:PqqD family protein [Deltaproteobacteria bacterium]
MELDDSTRLARSDRVATRWIGDEVLLVPIRSDPGEPVGLYTLNRTAAAIWELVDGSRTLADLASAICARFEVAADQALRDVLACCADLLRMGAVTQVGR